jgi:hypothetical protein
MFIRCETEKQGHAIKPKDYGIISKLELLLITRNTHEGLKEDHNMIDMLITILTFGAMALFGLRGILPQAMNEYGPTEVFLFALAVVPVLGTIAYEVAHMLRYHHLDLSVRRHNHA